MTIATKPRTQRKNLYNLPIHKRRKQITAALSKELKKEYGKNSIQVIKEDVVKILRGEHKGKKGKVVKVDVKNYKIHIEGITIKKPDGKEKHIPISPSNVMITELNLKDAKRKQNLKRN